MRLALISENNEMIEMANILGEKCTLFKTIEEFSNKQEEFSGVYCPKIKELLKIKVKIPYAYDITPKTTLDEMNYNSFAKFYSQLGGPSVVFVSDKKLNKNANWLGLNSYYILESANTNILFKPRKFLTPKLHIGYIYDNEENFPVFKNLLLAKKTNWVFHVYSPHEIPDVYSYSGDLTRAKEEMLSRVHVLLNHDTLPYNMSESFPTKLGAEAMLSGCVLVSSNSQGNNTHIFFDKFNYIKLDFVDVNSVISTLLYLDKRREKLEAIAKEGNKVVRKYLDFKEVAKLRVSILRTELS